MEVRDSVHVKTSVSERIGTEIRTTEQQMSANDAFEETQAAVEQRAKQYKRRHKAAVDSLSADSLSGNLPLQFKPNVQDTVSQKQQVAKLKTLFAMIVCRELTCKTIRLALQETPFHTL